jgi:hypothetical protein
MNKEYSNPQYYDTLKPKEQEEWKRALEEASKLMGKVQETGKLAYLKDTTSGLLRLGCNPDTKQLFITGVSEREGRYYFEMMKYIASQLGIESR